MPRLSPRPGFLAPSPSASPAELADALRDGLRSAEIVEAETGIPSDRVHLLAQGGTGATREETRLLRSLADFAAAVAVLPEDGEWGDLCARLASPDVADDPDIGDNHSYGDLA
jgi:hypothetical protein